MNRDFKGIWIPREIWLRKDISALEKNLWAEIHSLFDREKGGCYASNEYLMEFVGVKERRLQEMIANLKDKGLVVQVSFNGRERVIKAIAPQEDFSPCGAEVQKSAPLGCSKMHLSGAEKCTSHIYIDTSIDKRLDTPPIPPQKEATKVAMSAKADDNDFISSLDQKEKKTIDDPTVLELANIMIDELKKVNPEYNPPKNLTPMLTHIDFLLRIDKRQFCQITDVFKWALADSFWSANMFKPNPAKYLREKFDQLFMKMIAKPPKKERKFAPCSDDAKAAKMMQDMEARAL